MKSGVFDKNGVDIEDGDLIEVTIPILYMKPTVYRKRVIYCRGAFRMENERDHMMSCIGDFAPGVVIEVVHE